jgi:hypothetical protein
MLPRAECESAKGLRSGRISLAYEAVEAMARARLEWAPVGFATVCHGIMH